MPLMSKIRERLMYFFGAFAVFFILYIIFDWGMDFTGRKGRRGSTADVIGSVNGRVIHVNEFNELVRQAAEQEKKQTGKDPDDDAYQRIRQQVWDNLISRLLIERQIDKLGLTVTDQELVSWVRGDNPPDVLVRQFTDSTGRFNREAYDAALADPRLKSEWAKIESDLRREKAQQKLVTMLYSAVNVSDGDVMEKYIDQNMKMTADYILFDPGRYVNDTTVKVADDDLKQYYKENQEEFKQNAVRKLKYVVFTEAPSSADSAGVLDELNTLKQQIDKGVDFLEQAKTYSEVPVSEEYLKHGQVGPVRENVIFTAPVGSIVGPILDNEGYHLIKILDRRKGKETYVRSSHILFPINAGTDTVALYKEAREVLARIKKGEDFAKLARQFSGDPSGANGGDLGWAGKGRYVKPFEDALFRMRPGEVSGLVRTQFGLHIIKCTAKDDSEVKVADISMSIKASSQTKDQVFENAKDFAYLAKQGDFEKEAALSKYPVRETAQFMKGPVVPGIGYNDILMKFTFAKSLGDVSDPFRIQGGYGVFKISEVKEEGIKPFDEVKDQIRSKVLLKKKMEKVAVIAQQDYAKLKPADDLSALKNYDPTVDVRTAANFTPNGAIAEVGRDFAFVGAAMHLKPKEISKPFEGVRGYYIIQLVSTTGFDSTGFQAQKQALRGQLLQERRQRYIADWLAKLKDNASIDDNREQFFR